jgi:hypothetical protein
MEREIINNCRQGKCEKEEKVKDIIIVYIVQHLEFPFNSKAYGLVYQPCC